MNLKTYKVLMFMGKLPWRDDVLIKKYKFSHEKILLQNGWQYINYSKVSTINRTGIQKVRLMYKIISDPIQLPGTTSLLDFLKIINRESNYKNYKYIEILSIDVFTGKASKYGRGNFLIGKNRPFSVTESQVVKAEGDLPRELL